MLRLDEAYIIVTGRDSGFFEAESRRLVPVAGPLEGRVAFVTGGGGGLAEGICARLAADGASVAVVDVSREKAERVAGLAEAKGSSAIALEVDVSDRSSVEATVAEVAREPLDRKSVV